MSKEEQEGYPLHPDTKAFLEKELEGWNKRYQGHNAYYKSGSQGAISATFIISLLCAFLAFGLLWKYWSPSGALILVFPVFFVIFVLCFLVNLEYRLTGKLVVAHPTASSSFKPNWERVGINYGFAYLRFSSGKKIAYALSYPESGSSDLLKWCVSGERLRNQPGWKNLLDKVDGSKREPVVAFDELVERVRRFELDRIAKEKEKELDRIEKEKEKQRAAAQAFKNRLSNKLQELDKDGNGIVDDIEGDDAFEALLKKHEALLVEKEKEFSQKFVHKFIRMSSYLTQQRDNIQRIFTLLSKSQNHKSLDENLELLQSEVHTYQLLLLNSINMVTLLADDKVIDFWKTYEVFDSLNVYDSNHQRQLSAKLDNIGDGLNELMGSIDRMNLSMSRQLSSLHRLTESNGASMQKQLNSVNSNLKVNNVLNAVQIYQNHKTNKRLG